MKLAKDISQNYQVSDCTRHVVNESRQVLHRNDTYKTHGFPLMGSPANVSC